MNDNILLPKAMCELNRVNIYFKHKGEHITKRVSLKDRHIIRGNSPSDEKYISKDNFELYVRDLIVNMKNPYLWTSQYGIEDV